MTFFEQSLKYKIPKVPLKILVKIGINQIGSSFNIDMLKRDEPDILSQIFNDVVLFGASDGLVEPSYEWLTGRRSTLIENVAQQLGTQLAVNYSMDMKYPKRSYLINGATEIITESIEKMTKYQQLRNYGMNELDMLLSSSPKPVTKPVELSKLQQTYNGEL